MEVKGPGDTLQENQKVWIDVLLQAGISTEVCHVVEEGTTTPKKAAKAKARKAVGTKRKCEAIEDRLVESEDEPEQDYSQLDPDTTFDQSSQPEPPPPTQSTVSSPRTPRLQRVESAILGEASESSGPLPSPPVTPRKARKFRQVEVLVPASPRKAKKNKERAASPEV